MLLAAMDNVFDAEAKFINVAAGPNETFTLDKLLSAAKTVKLYFHGSPKVIYTVP